MNLKEKKQLTESIKRIIKEVLGVEHGTEMIYISGGDVLRANGKRLTIPEQFPADIEIAFQYSYESGTAEDNDVPGTGSQVDTYSPVPFVDDDSAAELLPTIKQFVDKYWYFIEQAKYDDIIDAIEEKNSPDWNNY